MALHKQQSPVSEAEYLAGEQISEIRHELINGDVYAMAEASVNHNRITMTLSALLDNHLTNTVCKVFASNMKLKAGQNFFYPDLMVACAQGFIDEHYTNAPRLIVEVLSKSTRRADHTIKRLTYQSLPSLKEYILIEQNFVDVEVCRCDTPWKSQHYFLGDDIWLESVELGIPVAMPYANVDNEDMREWAEQHPPE